MSQYYSKAVVQHVFTQTNLVWLKFYCVQKKVAYPDCRKKLDKQDLKNFLECRSDLEKKIGRIEDIIQGRPMRALDTVTGEELYG